MKVLKKCAALLLAAAMVLSLAASGGTDLDSLYDNIPESTGGKDIVRAAAADDVFSLNYNSQRSLRQDL